MALTSCKSCGNQIAQNALLCPHCGHDCKGDRANKFFLILVIIAAVLVAFALGIL